MVQSAPSDLPKSEVGEGQRARHKNMVGRLHTGTAARRNDKGLNVALTPVEAPGVCLLRGWGGYFTYILVIKRESH